MVVREIAEHELNGLTVPSPLCEVDVVEHPHDRPSVAGLGTGRRQQAPAGFRLRPCRSAQPEYDGGGIEVRHGVEQDSSTSRRFQAGMNAALAREQELPEFGPRAVEEGS